MSNPFYTESFTAAMGSLARSAAMEAQFQAIEEAFDLVHTKQQELESSGGDITNLGGFPSTFAGHGLKYLRVNAAEDAVEFVPGGRLSIKTIGGTSYTLLASDAGLLLVFTAATDVTVTVPANVLAAGDVVYVNQKGTGQITFAPGVGCALNSTDALLKTRTQHAQVALEFLTAAEATLMGERNAPSLSFAVLVGGNQFQGCQSVDFVNLTDAATIDVDAALSNNFYVQIGGNRLLNNPTNRRDGMVLNILVKQDATGGRVLTYSSKYKWSGGTAPALSTGAGALDLIVAQYNYNLDVWVCNMLKDFR